MPSMPSAPSPSAPSAANPFYQPAHYWVVRCVVPVAAVAACEEALQPFAMAISSFEVDEANHRWRVEVIATEPLTREAALQCLAPVGEAFGLDFTDLAATGLVVEQLPARDWISEVKQNFPPFQVARFYLYGSHITTPPPVATIPVLMDAGAAFGSGEHPTTRGCLLAIDYVATRRGRGAGRPLRRALDMGCGTAVLAIGLAKQRHVPVMAVDIDKTSTRVAAENVCRNQVPAWVKVACGNGYRTALAVKHAPYDLIIANILARPLVQMAPQLAKQLAPGGTVILSGLLTRQANWVMAAHRAQGLFLHKHYRIDGWSTLVLGA